MGNIYQWETNSSLNATIDNDISWRIGQIAGLTNDSMRMMMQRFGEYLYDLAPKLSKEGENFSGYFLECKSKLDKMILGLRFYLITHRDSKQKDKFSALGLPPLPIYIFDTELSAYREVQDAQLIKDNCYELLYLEKVVKEQDGWVVANFSLIHRPSTMAIGTITAFANVKPPKDWLICDGQELEKAQYPELYEVISDIWGKASADDKFKLPDLRGVFLRSFDESNKFKDAAPFAQFQESENKIHSHKASMKEDGLHNHKFIYKGPHGEGLCPLHPELNYDSELNYEYVAKYPGQLEKNGKHKHKLTMQNDAEPTEMRPVNIAINYIIKAL